MNNINWKDKIVDLVFIISGILIALAINNWNEIRKERIEENILLSNLIEEINFNLEVLEQTKENVARVTMASRELLDMTGTDYYDMSRDHLDSLLYEFTFSPSFDYSNTVLDDIIYSGKLSLIKNRNLKAYLMAWNASIPNFRENEVVAMKYLNDQVTTYLDKRIAFRNIEKYGLLSDITDSRLDVDNRNVLAHLEFENLVDNHLFNMILILDDYKPLDSILKKILLEVDKEIQ